MIDVSAINIAMELWGSLLSVLIAVYMLQGDRSKSGPSRAFVATALCNALLLFSDTILSFYALSPETTELTKDVFLVHGICAVIFWPFAFTLPNALRAANDVRFTMFVSLFSMWTFRIAFSYVLAIYFNMGVVGIWVAMCIDWVCRAVLFIIRFARGKWKSISYI